MTHPKTELSMIKEFQCPGCVADGSEPSDCSSFKFGRCGDGFSCEGHVPGTRILGALSGLLYLGLPKGMNRVGPRYIDSADGVSEMAGANRIRLHTRDTSPRWNHLNVPVWALEQDGYLFVRTFCPRTGYAFVDVIEGGTIAKHCPNALDVATFIDEID